MRQAGSTISIPTKLLATGVACALAVVVCGTAASVVVASEASGKVTRRSDSQRVVAQRFSPEDSFRDQGATTALLDSLLAPLGVRTKARLLDIATLNALNNQGRFASPVWETSPVAQSPGALPTVHQRRAMLKTRVDTTLDSAWRAVAERDTASPWMPVFRRWARSQPLPSLWGYRPGLPGVRDARDLPLRSSMLTGTLFRTNEEAGILALRSGQNAEATERALENISASRHLLEQPVMLDALVGRMWFRRGIALLTLAAGETRDTVTLQQARRLEAAARKFDIGARYLTATEADPRSRAAESVVANRQLHPAFRIEAMGPIILGGCRNTHEIVLGFSSSRRASMDRAIASVSDIPRGTELAQQYARFLEYAMSSEHEELEPPRGSILDRNELLKLFSWIVPPGVRRRAGLCLGQG